MQTDLLAFPTDLPLLSADLPLAKLKRNQQMIPNL
jgi:hypothetical protein